MRTLTRGLLIIAFFAAVSLVHSFLIIDRQVEVSVPVVTGKFIVLSDSGQNNELQKVRATKCGAYGPVLNEIQYRFHDRTEQQVTAAEWDYAYVATLEVVREAVKEGSFHSSCLVMVSNSEVSETSKLVLITPDGDVVVGYDTPVNHWREGSAFTLWSNVDHESWHFDTLAIADFTNGMSAKVNDEMVEVPIASILSSAPRGQRG